MTAINTPFATFTPVVTATPITETDSQNLDQILHNVYKDFSSCKSLNALNTKQDVLEFFDATNQMRLDRLIIHEIADSANNKYRAYLATDKTLILSNCEAGCAAQRIYIKDLASGNVRGINWPHHIPDQITYKLIWIGDKILAFQQTINPYNGETIAIDIEQKIIIYRSLESCN